MVIKVKVLTMESSEGKTQTRTRCSKGEAQVQETSKTLRHRLEAVTKFQTKIKTLLKTQVNKTALTTSRRLTPSSNSLRSDSGPKIKTQTVSQSPHNNSPIVVRTEVKANRLYLTIIGIPARKDHLKLTAPPLRWAACSHTATEDWRD